MSRIEARETIFKLAFELCFVEPKDANFYNDFLQETKLDQENLEFVKVFYEGIVEHLEEIKQIISENIKGYTFDRLVKVDLAILIVAIYELKFYKETKQSIVINEAVELAKKYSTEKSYSFINGVLANIVK